MLIKSIFGINHLNDNLGIILIVFSKKRRMSGGKFDDDDDDVPQLSAETLKALQEFYAESQENTNAIKEDWVRNENTFYFLNFQ